jgi:4-amino-4-deoxychorismate lyase
VELAPVPAVSLSTLYPASLSTSAAAASAKPSKISPLTGGALSLGPTDSLPSATSQPIPWQLHVDSQPTPSTPYTSLKTTRRDHYEASRARVLPRDPQDNVIHEVMLFNVCDEITEGSTTSLYFFRGGQWVTPPVGSTPTALSDAEDKAAQVPADAHAAAAAADAPEALQETRQDANHGEGDRLPSFRGRWGHSVRASTKWPDSGGQRGTSRRWALKAGLCMEEIVDKNSLRVGERVWVSNGVRGFHIGEVVG